MFIISFISFVSVFIFIKFYFLLNVSINDNVSNVTNVFTISFISKISYCSCNISFIFTVFIKFVIYSSKFIEYSFE